MRKPALSLDRVKRTFSSRETFLSYTIYKPNLKDITPFPLCTKHPGKSDWRKIEVWLDVGIHRHRKTALSPALIQAFIRSSLHWFSQIFYIPILLTFRNHSSLLNQMRVKTMPIYFCHWYTFTCSNNFLLTFAVAKFRFCYETVFCELIYIPPWNHQKTIRSEVIKRR